jgi:pimeloyl-ACP methyl ester carboxylesterase
MAHTETEYVVRGVKLRMFRGGEGDPVLMLHGAAGLSAWTPFFEAISQKHDLIVPEHPGFGKSDDPESLKSIGDLAQFYLEFVEQMGLRKFHLIGNSLGGWIAAELAIRDSSRLKSLTVVAPAGIRPKVEEGGEASRAPDYETRRLFFNQAIADRMLAQAPTEEQKRIAQKNRNTTAKLGNATFCNPDLEKALGRLTIPSLVVWGDNDRVVPVAHADIWKAALPNAQVVVVPECGHLPHAEKSAPVAERMLQFLAGAQ